MKASRKICFLLALLLVTLPGMTQGLLNTGNARGAGLLSGKLPQDSRFSLEMGTGFTSFGSGTTMLGNYVSPRFEYNVNPALTIVAGGSFSFNRYNNLPGQSLVENSLTMQGMTDHSLFVSGRYLMNENLVITGTVYREEGNLPVFSMSQAMMNRGAHNQGFMEYRNHGMSMGFEYRITDNFHFGAEIGINRSNNPYSLYSPFADPFRHRSRHPFLRY
jgi:hypothetical protein